VDKLHLQAVGDFVVLYNMFKVISGNKEDKEAFISFLLGFSSTFIAFSQILHQPCSGIIDVSPPLALMGLLLGISGLSSNRKLLAIIGIVLSILGLPAILFCVEL
jgi:hypothetical protein